MVISFTENGILNIITKAMNAEMIRYRVISNNIANSETPNFKRSDVTFEKELARAYKSQIDSKNNIPTRVTDERHIPFTIAQDFDSIQPKIISEFDTTVQNNGNNVDPDWEMVYASKTAERYNALSTFADRKFRVMRSLYSIM